MGARAAQGVSGRKEDAMWKIARIDHVVLWVRDLEKSIKFYEALGFEIDGRTYDAHRQGKLPFVACKAGSSRIELRPDPAWRPVAREKGNMQHVNVTIDEVEDIQIVIDENARRGVEPAFPPGIQGGSWRVDYYDPDNNRIEMALSAPAK
jgi:catechol 2,3-dioxygenase-like lactoylglutathione lyase family enzyme